MISLPIWVFVLLCVLGFIGALIVLLIITIIISAIVDHAIRNKDDEEKANAERCPEEIE